MLNKLLKKGRALFQNDKEEYEELKEYYFKKEEKDLAWYVGAGFDLSILEKKVHNEIRNVFLDSTPLLMSDFHPNCYQILKEAYNILSENCFTKKDFDEYFHTKYSHKSFFYNCGYYEINQMIAIKLFSKNEIKQIRNKYRNLLRYPRDVLIYDDLHVMCINLTYYYSNLSIFDKEYAILKIFGVDNEDPKFQREFDIFYFPMRALIMVKEIIEKFEIPLMSVFTLGSWKGGEYLGSDAEYFKALMALPPRLKPEFIIDNQRFLEDNPMWFKCAMVKNFNMGDAIIYRIKHEET